jgi:electron transport complex protein RnfG
METVKNPNKESDLQLVIVFILVCAISGGILTAVAKLTAEPIEKTKKEIKLSAVFAVLPEVANDPDQDKTKVKFEDNGTSVEATVFPGKDKNGNIVGYAVSSVSHKGYSGDIEVMVGVLPDGSIRSVKIVKQAETPGLGTKIQSDDFINQFIGKSLDNFKFKVKKENGDVDAITAATISSKAVTEAIEFALKAIKNLDKN